LYSSYSNNVMMGKENCRLHHAIFVLECKCSKWR